MMCTQMKRPLGSVILNGWAPVVYKDSVLDRKQLEITKSGIEKLRRRKYVRIYIIIDM